jgi:hypothetical protein
MEAAALVVALIAGLGINSQVVSVTEVVSLSVALIAGLGIDTIVEVIKRWLQNSEATNTIEIKVKDRETGQTETVIIDRKASAEELAEQVEEQIRTIRDGQPPNGGTPANS